MKIILKSHSFIDVITNSSTELFCCNSDKSLEFIKNILIDILDKYNNDDTLDKFNDDVLYFDNVFNEPRRATLEDIKELNEYTGYYKNLTNLNVGDVIIKSASDNSIPYELFYEIEQLLNAHRYHIG